MPVWCFRPYTKRRSIAFNIRWLKNCGRTPSKHSYNKRFPRNEIAFLRLLIRQNQKLWGLTLILHIRISTVSYPVRFSIILLWLTSDDFTSKNKIVNSTLLPLLMPDNFTYQAETFVINWYFTGPGRKWWSETFHHLFYPASLFQVCRIILQLVSSFARNKRHITPWRTVASHLKSVILKRHHSTETNFWAH